MSKFINQSPRGILTHNGFTEDKKKTRFASKREFQTSHVHISDTCLQILCYLFAWHRYCKKHLDLDFVTFGARITSTSIFKDKKESQDT